MEALQSPLSNIQLELLKVFSRDVSEEDLKEVKRLLTRYFAEKAIEEANKVWDEKGWTDEDAERMLHTHMRTPYQPQKKSKN